MEFWFSEFHTPDVKHSIRVNKQLYSKQSDYQRIDIFETPEFGRVLTLDGNVMLTERDEFIYDEMIVHVPMAVHKEAKDILVIGAGDGGVVRELRRGSCDHGLCGGDHRAGAAVHIPDLCRGAGADTHFCGGHDHESGHQFPVG